MPAIGDTKTASQIGYKGRAKYVWCLCPSCGTPRWSHLPTKDGLCRRCAAQKRAREKTPLTCTDVNNPRIGDTALARLLGYADRGIRYFDACPECGQGRWVRRTALETLCIRCIKHPTRDQHGRWVGGRTIKKEYILVRIDENDPMYVMSHNGLVLEHRLVVARQLGRPLTREEVVHHINGVKQDNRPENLRLLNERSHNSHLAVKDLQERVRALESKVMLLEADNVLLRATLSGNRDSVNVQSLRCYNTPSNHDDVVEGIVQPTSNGDSKENRCSCVRRKVVLRPSSEMAMQNLANSVKPTSNGYGNAELGEVSPSVETLHEASLVEDEDKVRLSSKGESE